MKNKTHLLYGIIIGILLTLCLGMTKEEQKQFKEIRMVTWNKPSQGFGEFNPWSGDYDSVIKATSHNVSEIAKAGWTIIDFEVGDLGKPYYLVGK